MSTTDLTQAGDQADADGLDLIPASTRSAASIRLAQQVQDMKLAAQFARSMCYTTAVPDIYRIGSKQNSDRKDEEVIGNAAAAIIYGNELGINASQSLQNIFSVGGKPSIYARTAVALLTQRGYKISTKTKTDESVTIVGVAPDGRTEESTWSIERATKAGYVPTVDEKTGEYRKNRWGKMIGNEKYLTDPITMLKAKAQHEVCRDLAPDVLMGFSEDDPDASAVESPAPRKVRNEAVDTVAELRARLALPIEKAAPKASDPQPEPESPQGDEAIAAPEPEVKKPTAAKSKKMFALFDRAGLTADNPNGRKILFASFFPDRDLGAAPSAEETDHVIGELEKIADSGEDDSVLVAFAEDVITSYAREAELEGADQ